MASKRRRDRGFYLDLHGRASAICVSSRTSSTTAKEIRSPCCAGDRPGPAARCQPRPARQKRPRQCWSIRRPDCLRTYPHIDMAYTGYAAARETSRAAAAHESALRDSVPAKAIPEFRSSWQCTNYHRPRAIYQKRAALQLTPVRLLSFARPAFLRRISPIAVRPVCHCLPTDRLSSRPPPYQPRPAFDREPRKRFDCAQFTPRTSGCSTR